MLTRPAVAGMVLDDSYSATPPSGPAVSAGASSTVTEAPGGAPAVTAPVLAALSPTASCRMVFRAMSQSNTLRSVTPCSISVSRLAFCIAA